MALPFFFVGVPAKLDSSSAGFEEVEQYFLKSTD